MLHLVGLTTEVIHDTLNHWFNTNGIGNVCGQRTAFLDIEVINVQHEDTRFQLNGTFSDDVSDTFDITVHCMVFQQKEIVGILDHKTVEDHVEVFIAFEHLH